MKNFKNITLGFVSSIALCFVAGCSQNEAVSTKPDSFSAPVEKTSVSWKNLQGFSFAEENRILNKKLENLAKSVARTLRSVEAQKELHKKVMAKFDGDTEILWNALNADQNAMNSSRGAATADNGQWSTAVASNGNNFGISSQ